MTDLHLTIIIIALIAAIILVWRGRPVRSTREALAEEEPSPRRRPPQGRGPGSESGREPRREPGREPVVGPVKPADGPVADSLALFAPARASTYTERFAEESPPPLAVAPSAPKAQTSRIVTLLVVARANALLAGPAVHEALHQAGLVYSPKRQMYQRPLSNGAAEGLFTVASILKPGHLDPAHAQQLASTGLAMFMVLPGPLPAADAFDDMLQTAGLLGSMLGAEVYDQRRRLLTPESVETLRAELLADFPAAA